MIKFEYDAEGEYEGHKHKVGIESSEDTYIEDIVSLFSKFLMSIGFCEPAIVNAFKEEVDNIKSNVKENHVMLDDSEEGEESED